jgi:ABC-type transporter Mla maintaining outer membrane lipid asymmetry ATPase subunit MlaF
VNIGSEPLTDPAIVLLDEPTSGLDSTSTVALMRILHDLVRDEGKTIITSIHQPSSAVFIVEYVRDMGLECPGGYNAVDHHMDLLVVDGAIEDDDDDDDDDEDDDGGGGGD